MNFDEEKMVDHEGGVNDSPEQKPEEIELEMRGGAGDSPVIQDGGREKASER